MKKRKNFEKLLMKLLVQDEAAICNRIKKTSRGMWTIYKEKKYVVVSPIEEGNYPLVASHYDTVRMSKYPPKLLRLGDTIVSAERAPIGGDDRCGVAIALSLIQDGIKANYCFFDEEEIGAGGSRAFLSKSPEIAKRSTCYIGLDRRGSKEAAVYSYRSDTLMQLLSQFGYEQAFGSMTDISVIQDKLPKAAANLSVGFTEEHTPNEKISIGDAYKTYLNMRKIIKLTTNVYFNDIESIYAASNYGLRAEDYNDIYSWERDLINEKIKEALSLNKEDTIDLLLDTSCRFCSSFDQDTGECFLQDRSDCLSYEEANEILREIKGERYKSYGF